jgi:hypothetical protein
LYKLLRQLRADIAFMTPEEPNIFDEAINHPGEDIRLKWRAAIKSLKNEFPWSLQEVNKVRHVERGCVRSKWVFKIKRNGVF